MSDRPDPQFDPDSPVPSGDVERFTRGRRKPARIVLSVLLAVLITAATFAILSVAVWAIAVGIH